MGIGNIIAAVGGLIQNRQAMGTAKRQAKWDKILTERQIKFQEDMAQQGIQWRVKDAQAAGLHPLAALGAGMPQYSPVTLPQSELASLQAQHGQDLTRAAMTILDKREQAEAARQAMARQAVIDKERASLNAAQIGHLNAETLETLNRVKRLQTETGPGLPNALPGTVQSMPSQVVVGSTANAPGRARQPGTTASHMYRWTPDGRGLEITKGTDVIQQTQDDIWEQLRWHMRHTVGPFFHGASPPPARDYPLPPGYEWRWDVARQAYYPERRGGGARRQRRVFSRGGN